MAIKGAIVTISADPTIVAIERKSLPHMWNMTKKTHENIELCLC